MATEQAITFPTTYSISCLGSSAQLRARRKRESGEICSGAGRVEMLCMVRPLKMAVLLLSVHALPNKCVLHLHPAHRTDIPTHLPQDPAGDCAYQRGDERHASLLLTLSPPYVNSPCNWQSPLPPGSEDCHHVLLTVGLTPWSVTPDLASDVLAPPSIKLVSLPLTPGSFSVLKLSKHRDLGLQDAVPHAIKQIMSFRNFR